MIGFTFFVLSIGFLGWALPGHDSVKQARVLQNAHNIVREKPAILSFFVGSFNQHLVFCGKERSGF